MVARKASERSLVRKLLRTRSMAGATDGKSTTTSSAKQSASPRASSPAITAIRSLPNGLKVFPCIGCRYDRDRSGRSQWLPPSIGECTRVQVAAPGGTDRGPGAPPLALLRSAVGVPGAVTISRTVKAGTTEGGMTRRSARAERQQKFLANRFVDLVEIQRRLAFIAQHFQYGRPPFFGNLDTRVLEVHHVHLESLHKKVLVVPTAGTGQRHARLLFRRHYVLLKN